jgi:rhodanese-related sulfurtransferase
LQADLARCVNAIRASTINTPRVLHASALPPPDAPPARSAPLISRHAVAHLLRLRGLSTLPQHPFLVDVRRHDEVTLFGALPESKHLPVEDIPFALAAPVDTFEDFAAFARPAVDQLLVFYSRESKRAQFAAAIAMGHGVHFASNR